MRCGGVRIHTTRTNTPQFDVKDVSESAALLIILSKSGGAGEIPVVKALKTLYTHTQDAHDYLLTVCVAARRWRRRLVLRGKVRRHCILYIHAARNAVCVFENGRALFIR